jgi:hypothetical protein
LASRLTRMICLTVAKRRQGPSKGNRCGLQRGERAVLQHSRLAKAKAPVSPPGARPAVVALFGFPAISRQAYAAGKILSLPAAWERADKYLMRWIYLR